MEGTPKAIELQGIRRNATKIGVQDGQAEDMLNLRFMDGSWRASGDGRLIDFTMGREYAQLYVHTNIYHHLLGVAPDPNNNNVPTLFWFAEIDKDGVSFYALQADKTGYPSDMQNLPNAPVPLTTVTGDVWITQTGHLLTIIDESDEFQYLIYIASEQNYKLINADVNGDVTKAKIYPFGVAHFSLHSPYIGGSVSETSVDMGEDSGGRYWDHDSVDEDNVRADIKPDEVLLLAQSAREGVRAKNMFNQPFLVCSAVRLYDGSFAYASNPVLKNPGSFLNYERLHNNSKCIDSPYVHRDLTDGVRNGYTTGSDGSFNANYNSNNSGNINGSLLTVMNGGNSYRSKEGVNTTSFKGTHYTAKAVGYNLRMSIGDISFIKAHPEIFQSICIFVTREIETIDYAYADFKDTDLIIKKSSSTINDFKESVFNVGVKLPLRSKLALISQMKKENFFLLREYKVSELDNILTSSATIKVDLNPEIYPGLLTNLVQNETLPIEAFVRDSYLPKVSYNYNGRLHIANYQTTHWRGYATPNYYNAYGEENEQPNCSPYVSIVLNQSGYTIQDVVFFLAVWRLPVAYVKITSRNSDGSTRVSVRALMIYDIIDTQSYQTAEGNFIDSVLNPLLCVGGLTNVVSIEIYAIQVALSEQSGSISNYVKVFKKTFTINHQDFQGVFSAYINPDLLDNVLGEPIFTGTVQDCFPNNYNPLIDTGEEYYNYDIEHGFELVPKEAGMTEYFPNGLKVSKTDQPMFFPVENTYQVGSAEILALMSNSIAVGTGQTGAAPLYVFCKDGVYALFVDASGEMTYQNSRVLARDVCNNPRSVTPIDAGVVFTTDRGLMMMAGEQVEEIGSPAEGDVLRYTDATKLDYIKIAAGALTKVAELPSALCDATDFLTYLKGAIINYNHNMRELMVSNPEKPYSYIMDREGKWTRRDYTASEYVNNYPTSYRFVHEGTTANPEYKFYKVDDEGTTDTPLEERKEADNKIFYLSNIIKLDSIGFKQAFRFVVRGYFETTQHPVGTGVFNGVNAYYESEDFEKYQVGDELDTFYFTIGPNGFVFYETAVSDPYVNNVRIFDRETKQDITEEMATRYSAGGKFLMYEKLTISGTPNHIGIYVFGSYDGRKWSMLGGNEKSGKFTDIGCKISRADMKFFRICLAGQLSGKSRIDYMEISSSPSILNTKIR